MATRLRQRTAAGLALVLSAGLIIGTVPAIAQSDDAAECTVLPSGTGLSANPTGANGESGAPSTEVSVSDEEKAAAAAALAGRTVGISQHIGQDDYTQQVVGAASAILEEAGATIVTSDAAFDPAKQVSDIENLLSQDPALLIVFPVDQSATVPGIQAANRAGVPVVVVGSALKAGGDVASLVTADNYEGGVVAAKALSDLIGGAGEVAIVPYKFSLWHVDERVRGFRDGVACTDLIVVEDAQTCTNDTDCVGVFADVLTAHPNLAGGFGAYDGIGRGMNAASLQAGWDGVVVTHDLGQATAQALVMGSAPLQATASQETLDQGTTAGNLALKVMAGSEVPPLVFSPVTLVTSDNVNEEFEKLFGRSLQ